jgi:hypothetical protein
MSAEQEDQDVEVVEYNEDIDSSYEDEDNPVVMMAPRILPGQEERQHWQSELIGGGIASTTAEGAIGQKMRKAVRASLTDKERFYKNVVKIAREADITNSIRDSVLLLIPRIPDVGYKSAAGMIFGFMALSLVGKNLNSSNKKKLDKIMEKVQLIKDKDQQISELDVCRYARLIQRILGE